MPRKCTICEHPKRYYINKAVTVSRKSVRQIAEQYGVKYGAVQNHKKKHLNPAIAKVAPAKDREAQAYIAWKEFLWLVTENKSQYKKVDERLKSQYLRELRILLERFLTLQMEALRFVNKGQGDVSVAVQEVIDAVMGG